MGKSQINQPSIDHRPKINNAASTTASVAAPHNNSSVKEVKPGRDQVQRRAYELYCQRVAKGQNGTPETDWLQAERELIKKS